MAATQQLSNVLPLGSSINDLGHLEIGGCDAVELAREFGTPAYFVAEDDIRTRARAFVEALRARHDDFDVLFASKAFPCTAVYRLLAEEGLVCDVASGGELHLALRGGFDASRIYLHGNAKSLAELEQAIDAGVGHVVLDSFMDIDRLERVAADRGVHQAVLIRVTPGVAGRTHAKISTGQADSKFGFGLDDARLAIERLRRSNSLNLVGLHMHIGSQLLSLEAYRPAVEALATLGDFPTYNFGGGLGVAYTAGQQPPAIEDYIDTKISALHEILGRDKRILIEPGRSLVANSTVTIYTVETIKRNVSTWVGVDGGMSDNLRPMLYGSVYEAFFADRAALAGTGERAHVAGKHCESGDVIVRDVPLHEPKAGDLLVTPATGAYGHAMANNYNGIPRPPVIFCKDGDARVVVRRETYDDLAARDV
ncbi:diaminopimelate decarboxylase [Conexibacter stalactiti]|uniref:Diaminopimelate decarboxylase n=1 Tax=Conexibacter stalactiti TaxID=1940611 RepID=A0ABU4HLP5_9ACTN|nr:diaminopimelate decarboxylase [Conexibacter stalactiti]MDW5594212.1 diaminopimelate decarboxylase [Conexibacter stalactiti]MEC5034854.1 diaminopimelate decarboxylase [Conexibacter stalactiti]